MTIELNAIGFVNSPRKTPEDDLWGTVESTITVNLEIPPDALHGLEQFSHAEIVFYMHLVQTSKIEVGSRHPRNNTAWPKVGIFAQRGKNRPNQIGVTICEILRVDGRVVHLRGLDAIDGTPVLDIKPYIREFGPRSASEQPPWATELMNSYFF